MVRGVEYVDFFLKKEGRLWTAVLNIHLYTDWHDDSDDPKWPGETD